MIKFIAGLAVGMVVAQNWSPIVKAIVLALASATKALSEVAIYLS